MPPLIKGNKDLITGWDSIITKYLKQLEQLNNTCGICIATKLNLLRKLRLTTNLDKDISNLFFSLPFNKDYSGYRGWVILKKSSNQTHNLFDDGVFEYICTEFIDKPQLASQILKRCKTNYYKPKWYGLRSSRFNSDDTIHRIFIPYFIEIIVSSQLSEIPTTEEILNTLEFITSILIEAHREIITLMYNEEITIAIDILYKTRQTLDHLTKYPKYYRDTERLRLGIREANINTNSIQNYLEQIESIYKICKLTQIMTK